MILVGDIHGDFAFMKRVMVENPDKVIIQVGDFGYWPFLSNTWHDLEIPGKVYFIEGNHDYLPDLMDLKIVTEVWKNAFYVPRSTVLELEDTKIGFIGGANSIDRKWRKKNSMQHGWFDEEEVTEKDVDKLLSRKPDIVIAHAAPVKVIERNFDPKVPVAFFGHLPGEWVDPSAINLQKVADTGIPYYCGHMHDEVIDGNVRILGINEVIEI